jgi:hypothetical protein
MKLTPFLAVTGFLLFVALSVLIQLAVAKWRYEKKRAEKRRAEAEAKRGRPS